MHFLAAMPRATAGSFIFNKVLSNAYPARERSRKSIGNLLTLDGVEKREKSSRGVFLLEGTFDSKG